MYVSRTLINASSNASSNVPVTTATRDPFVTDNTQTVGTIWINTNTGSVFRLRSISSVNSLGYWTREDRPYYDNYLNVPPYRYRGEVEAVTIPEQGSNPRHMVFDGRFMYMICVSGDANDDFLRWRPEDMSSIERITVPDAGGGNSPGALYGMSFDGERYIYIIPSNDAITVFRYDIFTESFETFYTDKTGYQMTCCFWDEANSVLWWADQSASKFGTYDPSTDTFTEYTITEGYVIRNFCYDGKYIWGGVMESGSGNDYRIIKIDPSDGSYTVVDFDAGDNASEYVLFDGTWVWAAHDTDPTRISRVDPINNTHETIVLPATCNGPRSMLYDGKSIWVGQKPYTDFLVQIDPWTMNFMVFSSENSDYKRVYAMGWDGRNIWCGMDGTTKRFLRWPRTR